MIESWLVSKLDTIDELGGQVYPVAASVGDTVAPFAIYSIQSSNVSTCLDGSPAFWTDTIRLSVFDHDHDRLAFVTNLIEQALRHSYGEESDLFIFHVRVQQREPDSFDLTMAIAVRPLLITAIYWRNVDG